MLKKTVLTKRVTVRYVLSDYDIAILMSRHSAYKEHKAEEARRAKEAEDKKAAEEVAKIDAEKKAKQAGAAAKKQTQQQQQQAQPKQSQSPQTHNPQNTDTNLPFKAICKDGTVQYQDTPSHPNYQGMCSGHGGIQKKLGRVP